MRCFAICLSILLGFLTSPLAAQPRRNPLVQAATCEWLRERLWIRESTGHNDGPAVAVIVKAGGGVPGQKPEYCGFTQTADQRAHGLPIPRNGMQGAARAWAPLTGPDAKRTFYYAGRFGVLDSIQQGDIVCFAWRPNPVIHHVTRADELVRALRKGRPPRGCYTLAGNEGHGTNAGFHRTFYPGPNITAAARWDYR